MVEKARTPEVNLDQVLDEVAKEKGVEKQALVETIEAAILKAAQNTFGLNRELEARYNPDKGHVELFQFMTVVEEVADAEREIAMSELQRLNLQAELQAEIGEALGFQIFWREEEKAQAEKQDTQFGDLLGIRQARKSFGRIAAQTAKQVLLQRVRDAERDLIYNEYKAKKGELIRGIVRRFERGNNIIVDLGKTEAVLSGRELPAGRAHRGLRQGCRSRGARPHRGAFALRPAVGRKALRGRGARNLRGHRAHRGRRPRGREPLEDLRDLA